MKRVSAGRRLLPLALLALALAAGHATEAEQQRRLRFTITVENPLSEKLRDQSVAIYMPVADTDTQTLLGLDVSTSHRVMHDDVGNTILELSFPELPPYATQVVSVTAVVELHPMPRRQSGGIRDEYLRQQPHIEVDDAAIGQLAAQLKGRSDIETAHGIYDWVRSNLQYAGFTPDDLGARHALRERRGDCTEYAYLVTALARANGIPARVLGGFVTTSDAAPRSSDYHNWAELYIDGGWQLVDAQKERFLVNSNEYVAMRIVSDKPHAALGSNHRFTTNGRASVTVQ